MVSTTITPSPDAAAVKRRRRKSRQTIIEEELWQLRLRTFVKSESLRLNTTLSPRSQLTFDDRSDDEGGTDMKNRQCRRNKRHNGKNFIDKMRDATRNARVFQLRIAGRRSWWPAASGPASSSAIPHTPSKMTLGARQTNRGVLKCCNDDRETYKQKKKDKREQLVALTSIDKLLLESDSVNRNQTMIMSEKRYQQERATINQNEKKNKFEWKFWKKAGNKKDKQNDIDETRSIDGDTVQRSITNTANNNNNSENNNKDNILDDDSAIMEIAEKIDTEEKKMKQKIVAAVATTSVSSLGVALAIILL